MAEDTPPRDQLEREIWQLTEWQGSAELMDALLSAADRYADRLVDQALEELEAGAVNLAAPSQRHPVEATRAIVRAPDPECDLDSTEPEPWQEAGASSPDQGKECRECGRWLVWEEFHIDKSRTDHRRSKCRDCCNRALREKSAAKRLKIQAGTPPTEPTQP